ncbi:MAG TPA: acetyl-CoA carboxylase biotin carboxyl carrier protein subunit [Stellaceae bacterium]|jgi:biotin carboxyl carrier protein
MTPPRTDVRSPVAGAVWDVRVHVGQAVAQGEVLLVVETMKVEVPLVAATSGTVRRVLVMRGDLVEEGQVLAVVAGSVLLQPVATPAAPSAAAPDGGGVRPPMPAG